MICLIALKEIDNAALPRGYGWLPIPKGALFCVESDKASELIRLGWARLSPLNECEANPA